MALTPCRECRNPVSADAPSCPRCGTPWPARADWKGWGFEWRSETEIWGYPLVHIAFGRDEHRRWRVAKGVIAIGQFAIGLITIAQFGLAFGFGFGQMTLGLTALSQVAITPLFGVGQVATGYVAIGQIAIGVYALGQVALGRHIWSTSTEDLEAVRFFRELARRIGLF